MDAGKSLQPAGERNAVDSLDGEHVVIHPLRMDELDLMLKGRTELAQEIQTSGVLDREQLRARIERSGKFHDGRIDLGIEVEANWSARYRPGEIQTYDLRIARCLLRSARSVSPFTTRQTVIELGRQALADNDRISFVDASLDDPDLSRVGDGFDAAVSSTALHWLQLEPLRQLYRSLAVMLKPGGILLNGDWLHGSGSPTIDALLLKIRGREAGEPPADEGETWDHWWEAIRAEPGLREAFAERDSRQYDHPDDDNLPTLRDHQMGLRDASFAEVGTVWQNVNSRVLVAIR